MERLVLYVRPGYERAGQDMKDEALTLREVAAELGVHYMTCYRYVRLGLLEATKHGTTWRIERHALDAFTRQRADDNRPPGQHRRRADWSRRYEARLLSGDRQGAWSVLEQSMTAGKTAPEIYFDVISPALEQIGVRWAATEIDISHEHRAVVIVRQHIGRLAPRFHHRGRSRGTVLLGCPAGEDHDIGLSMLSDLLQKTGFDCINLGADVPVQSFQIAAEEADQLVAVGISAHHHDLYKSTRHIIRQLRRTNPDTLLMVGGNSVTNDDKSHLEADYTTNDAQAAALWLASQVSAMRRSDKN